MNLLVISSYPEKNLTHGNKTVGVASYCKNTLLSIKKLDPSINITVLAEKFDKPEIYIDDGEIKVERIWKRENITAIINLVKEVRRLNPDSILAQFEMFMMGGFLHASVYAFVLLLLKIMGFNITIVLHQVVEDVDTFENNKLKAYLLIILKILFYKFLIFISKNIVVFEEVFAKRLGHSDKIRVIPHAVENFEVNRTKERSKAILGLDTKKNYILYFGFLSPYKGVDDLLKLWPEKFADYKLIIGGGLNPNHKDNPEFISYYAKISDLAKQKNAILTDFIPQEHIMDYFNSSEILILPYRNMMSSSGPLSIGLSYELPFLISEPMLPYFETKDFKNGLEKFNMKEKDFIIGYATQELKDQIENIINNKEKYSSFSRYLREKRSWEIAARQYLRLITTK
jgi:glycosyltransferase involved in cell wall biosynthesis